MRLQVLDIDGHNDHNSRVFGRLDVVSGWPNSNHWPKGDGEKEACWRKQQLSPPAVGLCMLLLLVLLVKEVPSSSLLLIFLKLDSSIYLCTLHAAFLIGVLLLTALERKWIRSLFIRARLRLGSRQIPATY